LAGKTEVFSGKKIITASGKNKIYRGFCLPIIPIIGGKSIDGHENLTIIAIIAKSRYLKISDF
jgi:hypothetical protein